VLLVGQPYDSIKFKPLIPDPKYPQYFRKGPVPGLSGFYNADNSISPLAGNFCKVLEIKADAKVVKQDIVLERASVLPVQIQDADGKPLRGVWAAGGGAEDWGLPIQCDEATCSAYQLEAGKPRSMVFYHRERKLAGTLTLKGDEKPPVVVKLAPAGSVKGRLLDADGKPLAGVVVEVRYRAGAAQSVHNAVHEARQIVTGAKGTFAFEDVIPEMKFELSFQRGGRRFERPTKPAEATVQVKAGECRDLGAIKLQRVPEKSGE
jgi:hypothetical protein